MVAALANGKRIGREKKGLYKDAGFRARLGCRRARDRKGVTKVALGMHDAVACMPVSPMARIDHRAHRP